MTLVCNWKKLLGLLLGPRQLQSVCAATHYASGRLPKVVSTVCVADLKLGFALNLVAEICGELIVSGAEGL